MTRRGNETLNNLKSLESLGVTIGLYNAPRDSCVYKLGGQLVALFWDVVSPSGYGDIVYWVYIIPASSCDAACLLVQAYAGPSPCGLTATDAATLHHALPTTES